MLVSSNYAQNYTSTMDVKKKEKNVCSGASSTYPSGTQWNPVRESIRRVWGKCCIFEDQIRLYAGGVSGNYLYARSRSLISVP